MAADRTGNIVLFGGYRSPGYLNDTWIFDGTTWIRQTPAVAPPTRYSSSMARDGSDNIILFGGLSSGYHGDTWIWA